MFSNNFCHIVDFSAHEVDVGVYPGAVSKGVSVFTGIARHGFLIQRAVAAHHKSNFRSSGNRTQKKVFHKTQGLY